MAKFKITDSFPITGRGEVLTGTIVEGLINQGDTAHLIIDGNVINAQIKSVEYIDNIGTKTSEVGLIIQTVNSVNYKDQLIDQIIIIN